MTDNIVLYNDRVPAIEAAGLVRTFGHTRAVDGIDLTVVRGTVFGLLGPNGAGKTRPPDSIRAAAARYGASYARLSFVEINPVTSARTTW